MFSANRVDGTSYFSSIFLHRTIMIILLLLLISRTCGVNFIYTNLQIEVNIPVFAYIKIRKPIFTELPVMSFLFKLTEFGSILIISAQLSIPFCIDNLYLFHTLFIVSHIFSTIAFFIIVYNSGGLQPLANYYKILYLVLEFTQ